MDAPFPNEARTDAAPGQHALPAAASPAIFILHPSDLLTDHRLNGDGLVACGFLRELAARGYRLHVACREVDLREPFPPNVILYPIRQSARIGVLGRLEYILRVGMLLRRLRATEDIGVAHQMNPVFAGLSLGAVCSGVPVLLGTYVARWPDIGGSGMKRAVARALRRGIAYLQQSQATAIMLTTPAALDRIAAPEQVRHKLVQMNHGIDIDLFSPSGEAPSRGARSILFYTSVTRKKGIFTLLEAFEHVIRQVPDATLSIVGKGEDWDEVASTVAAMPCRDRVTMRGFVPRQEAPALFRDHAVYCLPSFGEPFATTVLEAMACGRPLVVTAAGGLPYMVPTDGGRTAPPGDAKAIAEALLAILRSEEAQRSMGAINRRHIEANYTWEKVVDRLTELYAQLDARRFGGPARIGPSAESFR